MVKLTDEEKKELLMVARKTLRYYLEHRTKPQLQISNMRLNELNFGCFVTLKKEGELRGCIGNFGSKTPVWRNVQDMAVAAATEDPRFPRVKKAELDVLSVEISVLYPLIKVKDLSEIVVGRDGLYITYGFYSGVLLPQVATEYSWNRDEFLSHTCIKAGLSPDSWKRLPLEIYRFEADVFGEKEFGLV